VAAATSISLCTSTPQLRTSHRQSSEQPPARIRPGRAASRHLFPAGHGL